MGAICARMRRIGTDFNQPNAEASPLARPPAVGDELMIHVQADDIFVYAGCVAHRIQSDNSVVMRWPNGVTYDLPASALASARIIHDGADIVRIRADWQMQKQWP